MSANYNLVSEQKNKKKYEKKIYLSVVVKKFYAYIRSRFKRIVQKCQ